MVLLRLLAGLFLLVAVIALVNDMTWVWAGSAKQSTSLGAHWFKLWPASLNAAQAAVQRYVHPLLWDPGIQSILLLPAWAVLGTVALVFAWLGRRRRRINVYSN